MERSAMTNAQLYFAIAVPAFAIMMGVMINNFWISWHARNIEIHIDRIDARLDNVLKERSGL